MIQICFRRSILVIFLAVLPFSVSSIAQGNYGGQTIKWDDYTFKFLPGGQMAQVLGADGKVAGTILMMNGELQVMPLPGTDGDKLKKSFEDWKAFQKRSGGGGISAAPPASSPASATTQPTSYAPGSSAVPPLAAPSGPSKIAFDDPNQPTVARVDGITVSFQGEQIKIAGYGTQNYVVRHEKANPGRFLRSSVGGGNGTRAMGSLSGAGEQFLVDGGGLLFDSGMGVVVGMENDKQLLIPKRLSMIIVSAVGEIRAMPGHEKFDPPGYKSLKEISEYHLKSDGTQH
ncbi:MAG: hypothetical protein C5B58_03930 [Acidobacteria bacterium]|nr:MAG: hypothetical protein C5B58_03930 [Acidobacteriota bacterium]